MKVAAEPAAPPGIRIRPWFAAVLLTWMFSVFVVEWLVHGSDHSIQHAEHLVGLPLTQMRAWLLDHLSAPIFS